MPSFANPLSGRDSRESEYADRSSAFLEFDDKTSDSSETSECHWAVIIMLSLQLMALLAAAALSTMSNTDECTLRMDACVANLTAAESICAANIQQTVATERAECQASLSAAEVDYASLQSTQASCAAALAAEGAVSRDLQSQLTTAEGQLAATEHRLTMFHCSPLSILHGIVQGDTRYGGSGATFDCQAGFTLEGATSATCAHNGQYDFTAGPTLYARPPSCVMTNPCTADENDCDPNAVCSHTGSGTHSCECVNDNDSRYFGNGQTCLPCSTCPGGWEQLSTCTSTADVMCANPCAGVQCGDHGTCASGTCSCDDGYSGDQCETTTSSESPTSEENPCLAGAGQNYIEHGGYFWRTLDGADTEGPNDGAPNAGCQRVGYSSASSLGQPNYLPLPAGWVLAPNDATSIAVTAAHGWSTDCAVLADGSAWISANWDTAGNRCGGTTEWLATSSGLYTVPRCPNRVLTRCG